METTGSKIPLLPRVMLSALRRRFPAVEPARVWTRQDQEAPRCGERPLEALLADALKPYRPAIAAVTLGMFAAGVWLIYGEGWHLAAQLRAARHGVAAALVPVLAGVLLHGLLAVVVHEATHGNVLGRDADPWIGSGALGMLLMPFAAETYQHFHLIHHKISLEDGDPNWTGLREKIFRRSRLLYALYELIPIVNNFDRLPQRAPRDRRRVALAWALAVAVWALLRPPPLYVLLAFTGFNLTNAVRLWTEHFGFWRGQVASVYYCPLGFGIGNHALHHRAPKIPALSLMLGLMVRRRDASMLTAPLHLLFSRDYGPFHHHRRREEAPMPATGGDSEVNVAGMLRRAAEKHPDAVALHLAATGASVTFGALRERAGRVAAGLRTAGLVPGDRVLLMIQPGVDFAAAVFGVLAMGGTAVVIDPAMGPRRMLACLAAAKPRAMIAVRALHALRLLRPGAFRSVELAVSPGRFPGVRRFEQLVDAGPWLELAPRAADDPALISFTSGSTGEPKGVFQPHGVLNAQVRAFQAVFGAGPQDVLLAAFPALILLGPGLGCPVVLPEIDARRPAAFDPAKLAATIRKYGTTASFGSPAIWGPLGRYCQERDVSLPTMRCIAMGGAAIGMDLLDRYRGRLAPGAEPSTPYGATEAVPVTMVGAGELREAHAAGEGPGILVGRPVPGVELRILEISDAPLRAAAALPPGTIGEVAVRGEMVAPGYFERPDADALAKIPDGGGTWHRMGDLGFLDARGRLWFCGRKSERVETELGPLYTACVEPRFASDPRVHRVALVGVGERPRQTPVLVVEPAPGHWPRTARARRELAEAVLAARAEGPPEVRAIREVLFHRRLPLDIRHNAKVLRAELARWATRRLS